MSLHLCVLVSAVCGYSDLPAITNACVVTYVATPPQVILGGRNETLVELGDTFEDPGAEAVSEFFGDLPCQAFAIGGFDTLRMGTYYIVYSACDPCGNSARRVRTVHVAEPGTRLPGLNKKAVLMLGLLLTAGARDLLFRNGAMCVRNPAR